MPMRERWARVLVYEPPAFAPGQPPDWGIPEGGYPGQGLPGEPDYPDHGFHPEYPGQGLPGSPGYPGRPGQGLPRPSRNYPIVPGGGEMPDHPALPDLNDGGHWGRVHEGKSAQSFPAYVTSPEPPQVEDDYSPKHPSAGRPGSWVTVIYRETLTWAWCPSAPSDEGSSPGQGLPDYPVREPK